MEDGDIMGLWDKLVETGIFNPVGDWLDKYEPNWDEIKRKGDRVIVKRNPGTSL
jgi:hypothetical protein